MASPNIKVDRSVKIRRRHTLPGPLHKIRHQSSRLLQKRQTASCGGGGGGLPSAITNRGSTPTIPISSFPHYNPQWHHLHQSKTNPYVGWFRHAPSLTTLCATISLPKILSNTHSAFVNVDALWLRDWLVDTEIFQQQKKRRIVSMKDHNFTQYKYHQHDKSKTTIFHIKEVMENRNDSARDLNLDLLLLYKRRSGHLRGGGKEDDEEAARNELDDATIEQYLQKQYASSTESIAIKALSRIACWLLDVPLHPTTSTSSVNSYKDSQLESIEEVRTILSYDDDDDDDDDETRSECSYDNHDTILGSRFRTSTNSSAAQENLSSNHDEENEERYPVGRGLSSQAEAYYALGAVYRHILAENIPNMSNSEMTRRRSDSLDDIDRLDYEITQMDIVRMNRIASRHLDVESIVRLPVLTYHGKKNVKVSSVPTIPEKHEPIVSSSRPKSRHVDNSKDRQVEEEQHDAEFSWMLVPPTKDDDEASMEQLPSDDTYSGSFNIKSIRGQEQVQHEILNDGSDNDVCVICLELFIPGDRLRVLPCTHSFHIGCIDRWLSGSHSFYDCYTAGCPTCKVRPDASVNVVEDRTSSSPIRPIHLPLLHESDGSVPSWALARIGHILANESQHF